MKSFVFFLLAVILVYVAGNSYLFVRGWQSLEILGRYRIGFAAVFWIAAFSFIITKMLETKVEPGALFDVFYLTGSFWIAVMLYGSLFLLAFDLLRIAGWACNIRPEFVYANYPLSKAVAFGAVCVALSVIFTAGYRNAHRPKPTYATVEIEKKAGELSRLRVVMASDIHLGHLHGHKKLARIVDVVNEQQPDIVFLAGDILDGDPAPVIKKDLGAGFARIQSKYGTYIITGNHEYFGDRTMPNALKKTLEYLASRGVVALLDTAILIDGSFYIAGRKDLSIRSRKTLPEILRDADMQLPVIMVDHQPYRLCEAEQAGVDLQLSGHTHHGQMWPMNYITGRLFEQDWGYLKKGNTHYYISCGAGTWGPPIRTAGYAEIVVVDMIFQ